jgi:hypothetical protein
MVEEKNIKFFIIILAVAIVVPQMVLAAWWNPFSWGAWNRVFHFQRTEQKQEQQADQTADWKTYTNAEYGFEIKYPKDSIVINNPDSYDQSAKIRIMMADKFSDTGSATIKINSGLQSECKNSETLHPEEVKLNGVAFNKASFDDAAMGGQRGFITNYYVFKNNTCYLISGMAGWRSIEFIHGVTDGIETTAQELEEESQKIQQRKDFVNSVISTFKFTK